MTRSNAATLMIGLIFGAPATRAKDIVVAQTLDLSGQSSLGRDFSNGVRTYFDGVNARRGVPGRRIEFVQLDDAGRATDAVSNIDKLLLENDVDVLMAPTSQETLLAAATAPRLRATSLTLLGAPTGTDVQRAGNAVHVLPVRATYRDEARALLDYLKTFSDGTPALVHGDGPDADACARAFREEARARQLTLAFDGNAQEWLQRRPHEHENGRHRQSLCRHDRYFEQGWIG